MGATFSNTLRSLERPERGLVRLVPALVLLGAWAAWLLLAEVDVYASAAQARIETNRSAHRIAAETGGRILEWSCELGQQVQAGQLLVQLDPAVEQAQLLQEQAAFKGFQLRIAAVQKQLDAERAKGFSRAPLAELTAERAGLGLQQAVASASHQQTLTQIAQDLRLEELNSRIDAVTAEGALQRSQLQVSDAATEVARVRAAHKYEERAQQARLAELERELAELQADQTIRGAAVETVQRQMARLEIRAPAAGRIGNIAALQVGDVVRAGDVIASIIPVDDVRVVAEFLPEQAVGKVLPGQSARVQLRGFAWTEFGALQAQVTHVASEPRAGTIRVELAMDPTQWSAIPVQHGLPGNVDVRVEASTPWQLVRRSVGHALTPDANPAPATAAARLAGNP
jgi:membrane fusion protein (multidrug efflux system)